MSDDDTLHPGREEITRGFGLILGLILLSSALPYSSLPRIIGYSTTLFFYVVLFAYAVYHLDHVQIRSQRYPFILLNVIWGIFLLHLAISPLGPSLINSPLLRTPVFVFIGAVNLLFLPTVLRPEAFLKVLSRVTAIFVLIGLPSLILGPYQFLMFEITPWSYNVWFFGGEIRIPGMTSIFAKPNSFSRLVLGGALASLYEFDKRRSASAGLLLGVNVIGLYFGHSRMSMLAGLIAGSLYVINALFGRDILRLATYMAGLAVALFFLMSLGVVPGGSIFPTVNFTGRRILWDASFTAILNQPLIGYGPGETAYYIDPYSRELWGNPHNSYLRMFLTTGIIGGTAYLALFFGTLKKHLNIHQNAQSMAILAITIAYTLNQLSASFSLFGMSANTIPAAIAFGYLITRHQSDWFDVSEQQASLRIRRRIANRFSQSWSRADDRA